MRSRWRDLYQSDNVAWHFVYDFNIANLSCLTLLEEIMCACVEYVRVFAFIYQVQARAMAAETRNYSRTCYCLERDNATDSRAFPIFAGICLRRARNHEFKCERHPELSKMWSFTIDPADQRSAPREQETTPLVRKHPLPVSQRKGPRFHDSCAKRPARSQNCLPSASAFRSKSAMDTCTQCRTGTRCYAGEPYCVSMALRELDGCFHRGNCYQQGQRTELHTVSR